jgi:ABC-2 type transport system ATP-binding protein
MIQVENVVKRYGARVAVDGLSLAIPAGRTFGILGPNGAGKTTLLRMVMGLLHPDEGRIRLFENLAPGHRDAIGRIGYMPQHVALYESLTVRENVEFFGRLYGLRGTDLARRTADALERVALSERRDTRAGELSGGMLRRAMLASAVVHSPRLLILDEPTAGVDPLLRLRFWDWFASLADEGTTIIVTTHHISEAAGCQEVIFQRAGTVLDRGEPHALIARYGATDLEAAFVAATARTEADAPLSGTTPGSRASTAHRANVTRAESRP